LRIKLNRGKKRAASSIEGRRERHSFDGQVNEKETKSGAYEQPDQWVLFHGAKRNDKNPKREKGNPITLLERQPGDFLSKHKIKNIYYTRTSNVVYFINLCCISPSPSLSLSLSLCYISNNIIDPIPCTVFFHVF
jgi:hypothetical protein